MSLELSAQGIEWIHALGWTLLHFLWQGALVGAAYGLARLVLHNARPQTRYVLGLGSLALLAALPVLTFWHFAPVAMAASSGAAGGMLVGGVMQAVPDAAAAAGIEPWLPWLVSGWLVGVSIFSLRALWQYWRLRRLCREGAEPLPEWNERLAMLLRRFGVSRPVRLVKSAVVQTPSLIGWIAPVIVLPTSVLTGLTPHQIELVIAHELGHIRRWDYAVNLLQIALETVLFYHPVVHWISREVRNEREACCDDLVLRRGADPVDYASTLASLEELRGVTHAPALAASGGYLLGRIRRIVGAEPMFAAPLSGAQGLLVAMLGLAAVLSVKPVTREVLERDGAVSGAAMLATSTATTQVAELAAMTLQRSVSSSSLTTPPAVATAPLSAPAVAMQALATPAEVMPEAAPATVRPEPLRLALALPVSERPQATAAVTASDLRFEFETPSAPAAAPAVFSAELVATRMVAPVFPHKAALAGLEGRVVLGFAIDGSGRARDIRILHATDPGVFEEASIAALRGWRFPATDLGYQRFVQTFDFSLTGNSGVPAAQDDCAVPLGSRICRNPAAPDDGSVKTGSREEVRDGLRRARTDG